MNSFNKIIHRQSLTEIDLRYFDNFKDKFLLLENELKDYDNELANKIKSQIQIELSRQVAHDIRSPLAAINSLLEDDKSLENNLLLNSVKRINDIANKLLAQTNNNLVQMPGYHLLEPAIREIIDEKNIEHSEKKIIFNCEFYQDISAFIVPSDFKRIISNLFNNSIEATIGIPTLNITLIKNGGFAVISISDNGTGISDSVLQLIGKKSITTKPQGNGLGLNYAISTIKEWQGDLKVISTGKNGTTIQIELLAQKEINKTEELSSPVKNLIVLVDDDELTRATWEMKAKKGGINFRTYKDVDSFKVDIGSLKKNDELYIDSELGDIKGEALAAELHELGFQNISIASGHPPERFAEYTFLKSVISKKAPF